jgi:hypothetical protein
MVKHGKTIDWTASISGVNVNSCRNLRTRNGHDTSRHNQVSHPNQYQDHRGVAPQQCHMLEQPPQPLPPWLHRCQHRPQGWGSPNRRFHRRQRNRRERRRKRRRIKEPRRRRIEKRKRRRMWKFSHGRRHPFPRPGPRSRSVNCVHQQTRWQG